MSDERLEAISDMIRRGQPVGILEAIQAIDYQEKKRQENTLRAKIKRLWALLQEDKPHE